MHMVVTIKDIAHKVGVAHTTVSRALRGNPLISSATTERIRQIALEMGYRPSAAARSLKTNRSLMLGVVVSNMDDPFFSEILQGIEDGVQQSGYSLFVAASQRDPLREQKIVQAMVEHRADGVIICSTSFSVSQAHMLLEYGRPIVVINNQSVEDYRYSIFHDDVDGSRQVAHHLIDLGHQKIAYLGNASSGRTTYDRLSGYQQEMISANLPILNGYIHEAQGGSPEEGAKAAAHFLGLPERPTAVMCYNDMMAIGFLQSLSMAGVCVPRDCSVTGFDNIVFSAYTQPPLTTFDQPKRYIGAEAARLLLNLLQSSFSEETQTEPRVRLLKGSLLVRQSTARPLDRRIS
jgi:DNA-binding LacI/PurR family transcriptional regulator